MTDDSLMSEVASRFGAVNSCKKTIFFLLQQFERQFACGTGHQNPGATARGAVFSTGSLCKCPKSLLAHASLPALRGGAVLLRSTSHLGQPKTIPRPRRICPKTITRPENHNRAEMGELWACEAKGYSEGMEAASKMFAEKRKKEQAEEQQAEEQQVVSEERSMKKQKQANRNQKQQRQNWSAAVDEDNKKFSTPKGSGSKSRGR